MTLAQIQALSAVERQEIGLALLDRFCQIDHDLRHESRLGAATRVGRFERKDVMDPGEEPENE